MPETQLTRAEAAGRARLLSDVAYEVELDLTGEDTSFASRTVVRFACAEPGASSFIDLEAIAVEAATLNGHALPPGASSNGRLRLDDLQPRNELTVEARCAYQRTGVGLHRFSDPVDGRAYLHTQFEPFDAHRVFACFDQPDLKAPFTLTVHAPEDWTVVSNDPVAGHTSGSWRFAPTPRISTYLAAVAAGPYHEVRQRHDDLDLGVFCRQSLAEHLDSDEIFEITAQGFDFFRRVFTSPYPFGGKYDQLFVPEFSWGAMENPSCVTFSETYIFRSKVTEAARQQRASTILHEMAHMWFGDLVTMRWWDDLWLNESFATYMGHRALAEATRFRDAWATFCSGTKAWAIAQDQLPSTHPIAADIVDTDAVRTHFDGITYAKGASVLKQLVAWVGDEAFYAGLREYFDRHAWSNASLADFLGALERSSGRDLGAWSKQWLETAGVATLRPDFTVEDGRYHDLAIVQETGESYATLRDHRLAVGLYDERGGRLVRRRRVELDVTGARTLVEAIDGEPQADLLLLNDDDLTYAKLRLDERSADTVVRRLGSLDEPLARALCWGAMWDMTRDAELPARRFVELVAGHAAVEADVSLLQRLLGRAHAALERFGDPANRGRLRALLAHAARAALDAAEPGSDRQLVWARYRLSLAESQDEVAWARGLLDGEVEVPGLAIDTDLRWHIVVGLAAAGAADEGLIAAEAERDPTDMGARRAAAARAARPQPGAKAEAWETMVRDRSLTLAMRRALAAGFWQYRQDDVLEGYIDRFVADLPAVWDGRNPEESLALTGGMYPSTLVTQRTVEAADRALALPDLPGSGRRVVAEDRDDTLRALRARQRDRTP